MGNDKDNNNTGKKLAIGALVGAAAGFVAGILTAPKSGKETRQDIKNTANKAKREAEKQLKALQGELGELITKGKKLAKQQGEKAKKGFDEALVVAQDKQQKVKEMISALKSGETDQKELDKAIQEAKKAKSHLLEYLKS
ncbi:YtxH domain-containing protein [Candidatus Saccharibacteria bacterium]|nr:YtxH domain-containing protein [Candidatus Saccharibacteria bacterium]